MAGILYAVGVGPGEPELMTLKAVSVINRCEYIVLPDSGREKSVACEIVGKVCDLSEKKFLSVSMPMTKDEAVLTAAHNNAARVIIELLETGKDVAFLTLGDPSVYATTSYVMERVAQKGFETQTISGIPSFVAVAAKLNIPLGLSGEQIHIIPANYDIEEAVKLSGTRIFMKIGSKMEQLKKALSKIQADIYVIERCGMEGESVGSGIEALSAEASYFTIVVVKEKAYGKVKEKI